MKFKGNILITDPCYIAKGDDWEGTDYGKNLSVIGITKFLTESSGGDGSWKVLKTDKSEEALEQYEKLWEVLNGIDSHDWPEKHKDAEKNLEDYVKNFKCLGEFCADSGTISVMDLEQVTAKIPSMAAVIHDFDGDITIKRRENHGISIIGKGNINFFTV